MLVGVRLDAELEREQRDRNREHAVAQGIESRDRQLAVDAGGARADDLAHRSGGRVA